MYLPVGSGVPVSLLVSRNDISLVPRCIEIQKSHNYAYYFLACIDLFTSFLGSFILQVAKAGRRPGKEAKHNTCTCGSMLVASCNVMLHKKCT